jgi:hypothetical protein
MKKLRVAITSLRTMTLGITEGGRFPANDFSHFGRAKVRDGPLVEA